MQFASRPGHCLKAICLSLFSPFALPMSFHFKINPQMTKLVICDVGYGLVFPDFVSKSTKLLQLILAVRLRTYVLSKRNKSQIPIRSLWKHTNVSELLC